jgi:hypothetical protein
MGTKDMPLKSEGSGTQSARSLLSLVPVVDTHILKVIAKERLRPFSGGHIQRLTNFRDGVKPLCERLQPPGLFDPGAKGKNMCHPGPGFGATNTVLHAAPFSK